MEKLSNITLMSNMHAQSLFAHILSVILNHIKHVYMMRKKTINLEICHSQPHQTCLYDEKKTINLEICHSQPHQTCLYDEKKQSTWKYPDILQ